MNRSTSMQHFRSAIVRVGGPAAATLDVLRDQGVDPRQVLVEEGLATDLFDDPENAIPLKSLVQLLQRCAERTGCPHFGLTVGKRSGLRSLGLVGLVSRSSPDVETAVRRLVSYMRLQNSATVVTCSTSGATTTLTYDIVNPGVVVVDQFVDGAVAVLCNILRELCGPSWVPDEVRLARSRPADVGPFRRHFRAPLRFDAPGNAILFPSMWLKRRLPEIDPELDRLLRARIAELEARYDEAFPDQVRRVLQTGLVTGHADADQIASLFSMHRRTLTRRLDSFGTCFKTLVDEGRYELAQRMLQSRSTSVGQIALTLGYADASSFTRAFRRWSGTTPARWRRRT
jgi:AraC-like DNA-binding protein